MAAKANPKKAKSRKAAGKSKPAPKAKPVTIKTRPTAASVDGFLRGVEDEQKRKDSRAILEMMRKATGEPPKMWGSSIIGFGEVKVRSPATGREVDWMRIGFAPRKTSLSLYLTGDVTAHAEALKKLGPHKTGVGCLYIKRLEDVDVKVLERIIERSLKLGFDGQGA